MAVSSPALPPMGAVLGAAFDRALTIVVGSWRLFLIVAVLALLGGFVNIAISAIILGTFLTYFYFASLANAIRLDIPGYAMTGAVVARLILFGIVYGLAVDIGLILFIVPGIYVATKWSLAPIIIAKEDASLGDALAKSWALTEFCFWQTLGFQILAGLGVFAVTIVGGLIGELVATAVFWSVFHTATAGGPSG
ncbi:MAG TPA: hypothetical protein VEJ20_03980, partial [Candidatus Eremiobacteraceae bacterium]|nr:hypothetical protein [Candidatus Eremiobacteraceae bacterium]